MAEEQRCQEGHRLCANNCGFFGSPATLDLCSKCYHGHRLKEEQASSAKIAVEKSFQASPSSSPSSSEAAAVAVAVAVAVTGSKVGVSAAVTSAAKEVVGPAQGNRCWTCRRKVGLTGFKCRCGMTYCGAHRYPEHHACTFDFKAAGREAIARANPVVKADKLDKI